MFKELFDYRMLSPTDLSQHHKLYGWPAAGRESWGYGIQGGERWSGQGEGPGCRGFCRSGGFWHGKYMASTGFGSFFSNFWDKSQVVQQKRSSFHNRYINGFWWAAPVQAMPVPALHASADAHHGPGKVTCQRSKLGGLKSIVPMHGIFIGNMRF